MENYTNHWSVLNRKNLIDKTKSSHFDVIIIGGGITGAGIARELSLRNYSFLLIDKNDFAFGTSSRSSKMIHGGFRYIRNGQFNVTRESSTERNWLRCHVPHLVRPQSFSMVAYEDYMSKAYEIKFGTRIYHILSDFCSKFKNFAKPRMLSKEEMLKYEPAIRKEKLIMGGYYYDNIVDDARLTLETLKEALIFSDGASVALNYLKVEDFVLNNEQKIIGVKIHDELSDEIMEIKGDNVVNATGIWTDELLHSQKKIIRPTKGVHIVVPNERFGNVRAFGLKSRIDGRTYFALRRGKFSIIGTTDTDYNQSLDSPNCTKEDSDYLLDGVNFLFPDAKLTDADIVSSYAGIRPLVIDPNASDASAVSRKHEIVEHSNGLISLIGGKLTIFRLMGEQLVYHMIETGKLEKPDKYLLKKNYSRQPYMVALARKNFDLQLKEGIQKGIYPDLDEDLNEYLYTQYGKQAFSILEKIKQSPELGKRFYNDLEFIPAEIIWICEHECAPHVLDIINRRTEMSLFVHHSKAKDIAEKVGRIMQGIYSWSEQTLNEEIQSYVDQVNSWKWM